MAEQETHFIGKITQKALIYHDGKVLLARDVGEDRFDIPGGRLNVGEQPRSALAREIKEEICIDIEVGAPFYTCTTVWGKEKSPHYFVVFDAELISSLQDVRPDGVEVEELRWVTLEDLTGLTIYDECVEAIREFYARKK